ncbi:MAG TPA: hypothetical protein VF605_19930 [Allosphingosinicella sp.]|jgi:hypothetical protein
MGILCRLGQHQAAPQVRANRGAAFGRCRHCGCDLILAESGWRPIPRGYRIVWGSAPPERAADPAQLQLELPDPPGPPVRAARIARPAEPPPRRRSLRTGDRLRSAPFEGRVTA